MTRLAAQLTIALALLTSAPAAAIAADNDSDQPAAQEQTLDRSSWG